MGAADMTESSHGNTADDRFTVEDLPWLEGFLVGVATYALAYVLVGGLFAVDLASNLSLDGGSLPDSTVSYLGWVFYSAHFVTVDVSLFTFNLIDLAASATSVPSIGYFALPPTLVVGAGYVLGRWRRPRGAAMPIRALTGAMVAVGYLPAMVVGTFVVATEFGGPNPALAFFYGLGYAVVFGAIGGVAAGE